MSLINDALKRAQVQKTRQEQESRADRAPSPVSLSEEPEVLTSSRAPRRGPSRAIILMAATLLVGGAVVPWQLLGARSGGSTPQSARAADAMPAAAPAVEAPVAAAPAAPATVVLSTSPTRCAEVAPNDPNGPSPRSSPEHAPHAKEFAPSPPALQPVPKSDDQAAAHLSEMAPAPPASAGTKTYVVKRGNTLTNIARAELGSERRMKDIQNLNPGLDPAKLKIGQEILIPAK